MGDRTAAAPIESLARALPAVPAPQEAARWFPIVDIAQWRAAAVADPLEYWRTRAATIAWDRAPQLVLEGELGTAHWFADGRLNATVSCLDRHAASHPDAIAYHYLCENGEARSIAYSELLAQTNRLANALAADGVGIGDRVAIYMPISIEGIVAMLACARLGATHCAIFSGMGAGALVDRINDVGAEILIAADVTYRRGKTLGLDSIVAEAAARIPRLRRIVKWRRTRSALGTIDRDWGDYLAGQSEQRAAAIVAAEHPLFVLHTSGTTGKPKGIVHGHGGFLVGVSAMFAEMTGLTPSDVWWVMSELGWMTAHAQIVYAGLTNRYCILIREGAPDFPAIETFYETIERRCVTQIYTVPTFGRMLAGFGPEPARKYDLGSLRAIYTGGERLDPATFRFFFESVGQGRVAVCQHWGQTETAAPPLGYLPTSEVRPELTGKAFGPFDLDVVDAKGSSVARGSGGDLVARASWPHLFIGVWNDPQRYADYFSAIPGCYASGDLAIREAEGYINVAGRSDDVISVAAHRLGPTEIEDALKTHPACADAAVIGKPDELRGERIKAFVLLAAGYRGDESLSDELIELIRSDLGAIATPSEIEFVESIPKTRSGKVMRRLLKARELGLEPGDVSSLEE